MEVFRQPAQSSRCRPSWQMDRKEGQTMLNLSSNDYLGLSSRQDLRNEFIGQLQESGLPFSSSSSRLLTGNFPIYTELEELMAERFEREAPAVQQRLSC